MDGQQSQSLALGLPLRNDLRRDVLAYYTAYEADRSEPYSFVAMQPDEP